MASNRSLHFSDSFVISCGTVTLDLNCPKVLLIYWRKTGEYFLPKGRKDVSEGLEQTALRETFEETGYRVKLLPLSMETLATAPSHDPALKKDEAGRSLITEPFAVTQRTTNDGVLKIIFWYVASANCTEEQCNGTRQEGEEDFESVWLPPEEAVKTLSFSEDRQITEKALQCAKHLCADNTLS